MVPSLKYSFLSSKLVKEVCMLGGSLTGLIAPQIEKNIIEKFKKNKKTYNRKKG
jgi:pantetheine-phosphate adenylyltransferase